MGTPNRKESPENRKESPENRKESPENRNESPENRKESQRTGGRAQRTGRPEPSHRGRSTPNRSTTAMSKAAQSQGTNPRLLVYQHRLRSPLSPSPGANVPVGNAMFQIQDWRRRGRGTRVVMATGP
ncbi:unnamed protein product [Arctogadus glacialis]